MLKLKPIVKLLCAASVLSSSAIVLAHGDASLKPQPMNRIDGSASFSFRDAAYVEPDEYWRIPGFMMGGESYALSQGALLDDAFVQARYEFYPDYTVNAKLAAHGGGDHSEVEFEHFWFERTIGKQDELNTLIAVGRMSGGFTPSANWHSSLDIFSEAPLNADIFFGRYYNDTGLHIALNQGGWSIGLDVFNGDAFSASAGEGSVDVFAQYLLITSQWLVSTGIWAMQSEAVLRGDTRFSGDHSHSAAISSTQPLDARYSGDNVLYGAYLTLNYQLTSAWGVGLYAEAINQTSEGVVDIIDNGRSGDVELESLGWQIQPSISFKTHKFTVRYEQLTVDNTILGSSPSFIAVDANLLNNDFTPKRTSISYSWQFNPKLKFRSEYVWDESTEISHNRFMLGLVWQTRLWEK